MHLNRVYVKHTELTLIAQTVVHYCLVIGDRNIAYSRRANKNCNFKFM